MNVISINFTLLAVNINTEQKKIIKSNILSVSAGRAIFKIYQQVLSSFISFTVRNMNTHSAHIHSWDYRDDGAE